MSFTICIYCGSRTGNDPSYTDAARLLGSVLADHGWRLVYGGGSIGLMGTLAHSALAHSGEVIGIIPQALLDREIGLVECSQLIVTQTLRQRKALMEEYADAFMALPGGFGTLEELIETLTLRQLGYHNKPIILVNLNSYYDPLLALFDHAVAHGYVLVEHTRLYHVVTSIEEAIALLETIHDQQPVSYS